MFVPSPGCINDLILLEVQVRGCLVLCYYLLQLAYFGSDMGKDQSGVAETEKVRTSTLSRARDQCMVAYMWTKSWDCLNKE